MWPKICNLVWFWPGNSNFHHIRPSTHALMRNFSISTDVSDDFTDIFTLRAFRCTSCTEIQPLFMTPPDVGYLLCPKKRLWQWSVCLVGCHQAQLRWMRVVNRDVLCADWLNVATTTTNTIAPLCNSRIHVERRYLSVNSFSCSTVKQAFMRM